MDIPALKNLTDVKDLAFTWDKGVVGVLGIAIGLFLCFSGKKFFKLFLGLVGLIAGTLAAFFLVNMTENVFNTSFDNTYIWVAVGILGILGAILCIYAWKIGFYSAAGLGGYMLASYLLSLYPNGVIQNKMGHGVILTISAIIGVVVAMYFEEMTIVISSCIVGSIVAMCGLDCFLNTGFAAQMRDQVVINRAYNISGYSRNMMMMIAGTLGLAVLGAVVQLLVAPSKGFGRAK